MSKTIVPRGKWVLIKPAEKDEQTTKQGLFIPSTEEREQKAHGEVLNVGKEITDIEVGDKVIYGVYAGETVKMRDDNDEELEYKLILEEDIIAFLR